MRGERLLREFVGRLVRSAHEHDRLPGGLADDSQSNDFDALQLTMGIEHEMEHTADPDLAREIAMDHLVEDPKYYEHLEAMESNEAFDHHMPNDKAYKKRSVYVPKEDKKEIDNWLDDMGMSGNRSKKRMRSK